MVNLQRRNGVVLKPRRSSFETFGKGRRASLNVDLFGRSSTLNAPQVVEDILAGGSGKDGEKRKQNRFPRLPFMKLRLPFFNKDKKQQSSDLPVDTTAKPAASAALMTANAAVQQSIHDSYSSVRHAASLFHEDKCESGLTDSARRASDCSDSQRTPRYSSGDSSIFGEHFPPACPQMAEGFGKMSILPLAEEPVSGRDMDLREASKSGLGGSNKARACSASSYINEGATSPKSSFQDSDAVWKIPEQASSSTRRRSSAWEGSSSQSEERVEYSVPSQMIGQVRCFSDQSSRRRGMELNPDALDDMEEARPLFVPVNSGLDRNVADEWWALQTTPVEISLDRFEKEDVLSPTHIPKLSFSNTASSLSGSMRGSQPSLLGLGVFDSPTEERKSFGSEIPVTSEELAKLCMEVDKEVQETVGDLAKRYPPVIQEDDKISLPDSSLFDSDEESDCEEYYDKPASEFVESPRFLSEELAPEASQSEVRVGSGSIGDEFMEFDFDAYLNGHKSESDAENQEFSSEVLSDDEEGTVIEDDVDSEADFIGELERSQFSPMSSEGVPVETYESDSQIYTKSMGFDTAFSDPESVREMQLGGDSPRVLAQCRSPLHMRSKSDFFATQLEEGPTGSSCAYDLMPAMTEYPDEVDYYGDYPTTVVSESDRSHDERVMAGYNPVLLNSGDGDCEPATIGDVLDVLEHRAAIKRKDCTYRITRQRAFVKTMKEKVQKSKLAFDRLARGFAPQLTEKVAKLRQRWGGGLRVKRKQKLEEYERKEEEDLWDMPMMSYDSDSSWVTDDGNLSN